MKAATGFVKFWEDKRLSPQQKNKALVDVCRRLFGTPDGKIVLNMLLTDLFLFEEITTDKDRELNEYAKFFIRERLGVSDTIGLTDFIAETAVAQRSK